MSQGRQLKIINVPNNNCNYCCDSRQDSDDSWFSQPPGRNASFWFLRNNFLPPPQSLDSGRFENSDTSLDTTKTKTDCDKDFSEDYIDTEESESIYATKVGFIKLLVIMIL